jgi:ABC-type Fe3+-hydroxamate transport system substrate-binding protein
VGGGLDPSVESIVALKPDLVLLSNASRWRSVWSWASRLLRWK